MIFATLSLLLASTALFAASLVDTVLAQSCGSEMDQASVDAAEANFRQLLSTMDYTAEPTTASLPISVIWHVIQRGDGYSDGNVPDSQIKDSIDALNYHYSSSGISFTLTETTRITSEYWFNTVSPWDRTSQTDMKAKLHEGDATTLNVYTVGFESGSLEGLLGYSTFPWQSSDNLVDDGVVIRYSTLPGGSLDNYNEGKSLTHEVGHWLGLYHVFQGGCTGDGDLVDDTPPQDVPTTECPYFKNTCVLQEGWDSIHNYMDYSYDKCMREFTYGQSIRMKAQILAYRGIKV